MIFTNSFGQLQQHQVAESLTGDISPNWETSLGWEVKCGHCYLRYELKTFWILVNGLKWSQQMSDHSKVYSVVYYSDCWSDIKETWWHHPHCNEVMSSRTLVWLPSTEMSHLSEWLSFLLPAAVHPIAYPVTVHWLYWSTWIPHLE